MILIIFQSLRYILVDFGFHTPEKSFFCFVNHQFISSEPKKRKREKKAIVNNIIDVALCNNCSENHHVW